MFLTDMLALSHVPRWSIVPHRQPQNVGDHTFRVLVIFTTLAAMMDVKYDASDLSYVLAHDYDESRTGDIPTPAKAGLMIPPNQFEWSSAAIGRVFDLADLIEAFTFIEKHGIGDHARRVAIELRKKIACLAADDYGQICKEVIDPITYDMGR